jgi:transcriptional regulator NrdR family protein
MLCPHCKNHISLKLIKSEAARAVQSKRVYRLTERPCPKCAKLFGARDLRKHLPLCRELNN